MYQKYRNVKRWLCTGNIKYRLKKANRCYPFVNVWFKLTPLLFLSKNYQISIQRKENGFRLPKAVTTAKYSLFYWARGYMNIEWIQEVSKTFWILHNEHFFTQWQVCYPLALITAARCLYMVWNGLLMTIIGVSSHINRRNGTSSSSADVGLS